MQDERNRFVPHPDAEKFEEALQMQIDHIRYDIKNLRDDVLASPRLPNREQVLRAFEDILTLLPPKSEREEAMSEYLRRTDKGEVLENPEDPGDPTKEDLEEYWREAEEYNRGQKARKKQE